MAELLDHRLLLPNEGLFSVVVALLERDQLGPSATTTGRRSRSAY